MRLDQREPLGWQRGTGSSFGSGQPPLGRRGTMFNQACEPTSHPSTLIRLDGRTALRQMSAIFTTFIFFFPSSHTSLPFRCPKSLVTSYFSLQCTCAPRDPNIPTCPQKMSFNTHPVWLKPVVVALADILYTSDSWARESQGSPGKTRPQLIVFKRISLSNE